MQRTSVGPSDWVFFAPLLYLQIACNRVAFLRRRPSGTLCKSATLRCEISGISAITEITSEDHSSSWLITVIFSNRTKVLVNTTYEITIAFFW